MNHVLQVTDWLAHVPKEVIAKNFQLDITAFDHIPSKALFIFPSSAYPVEDLVNPHSLTIWYPDRPTHQQCSTFRPTGPSSQPLLFSSVHNQRHKAQWWDGQDC